MDKRDIDDILDEAPPIVGFTYDVLSFGHRLLSKKKKPSNKQIEKSGKQFPSYYSTENHSQEIYDSQKIEPANTLSKNDESVIKGSGFEDFVMNKFDKQYFSIVEKTHHFTGIGERYIESNLNPDFIFRHEPTKTLFAVEAKYRSSLNKNGMLEWCNQDQLNRYRNFAFVRAIPIYIAIGLYGMGNNPQEFYMIRLEVAKYPALYPSVYKRYSVSPSHNFYCKNGRLH
jgi:hypothetical protein